MTFENDFPSLKKYNKNIFVDDYHFIFSRSEINYCCLDKHRVREAIESEELCKCTSKVMYLEKGDISYSNCNMCVNCCLRNRLLKNLGLDKEERH